MLRLISCSCKAVEQKEAAEGKKNTHLMEEE